MSQKVNEYRIGKILEILESQMIRFKNSEIVKRTGAKKSVVSDYLRGVKPISDNFYRTFLEKFEPDNADLDFLRPPECKEVTGTEFEKLRLSRKLNQEEMAEVLGISQQVYSNIETGRTKKIDYETYQLFIEFRNTKNTLNNMDNLTPINVTVLINSNKTLVDTNAQLVQMFVVSNKKENAPVTPHISSILLPYLQRIAEAGTGRFWDSESEGMTILNTIVIEPLDFGQELGKQVGSDN